MRYFRTYFQAFSERFEQFCYSYHIISRHFRLGLLARDWSILALWQFSQNIYRQSLRKSEHILPSMQALIWGNFERFLTLCKWRTDQAWLRATSPPTPSRRLIVTRPDPTLTQTPTRGRVGALEIKLFARLQCSVFPTAPRTQTNPAISKSHETWKIQSNPAISKSHGPWKIV